MPEATGEAGIIEADTHRIPIEISFFHSMGVQAQLKATYIAQEGIFEDASAMIFPGDDQFWVVDASIGYRLPKRRGLITIEARNLFNNSFNFQDMDPGNPGVSTESLIVARLILAF